MGRSLACVLVSSFVVAFPPVAARAGEPEGFTLHGATGEAAAELSREVAAARERVAAFFGHPFGRAFEVRVFASRAELDAHWRQAWNVPELETECWMVASGTASELAILSPEAWAKDACEHDAADAAHLSALVAHELVHVYHAQHNPRPDFDGLDAIAWFAEGLAVHASGQLDDGHLANPREAIELGKAPARLAEAWTGKYRYGVSGSLVRFVDRRLGRERLFALLAATRDDEILATLGMSEAELLVAWREETVSAGR